MPNTAIIPTVSLVSPLQGKRPLTHRQANLRITSEFYLFVDPGWYSDTYFLAG